MATADAPKRFHLDVISQQISEVFERLLSEVKARRDELLAQVDVLRELHQSNSASVLENIRELEEMRVHTEKMSVKLNLAVTKQQESLADLDLEIQKLKNRLNINSEMRFNCSIDQLIIQVKQFGKIFNESCIQASYRSKLTTVKLIKDNLPDGPTIRLHIDYDGQRLHVYSSKGFRNKLPISVFDVCTFRFIQEFGDEGCAVYCMATSRDFLYICTSVGNRIRKSIDLYKQSDYSFVKECTGFIGGIQNIFTLSNNQVLVLLNYLFRLYDRTLNFEREVQLDYEVLSHAPITHSLLREDKLFILLNKQVLVFDKEGKNINTLSETEGFSSILKNPTSFYICEAGYIMVSDSGTDSIKFFTPEGDLFHKIGEDTIGSDLAIGACDIVLYRDKLIVACYDKLSEENCASLRIY